jgi:NhaP-type Na+/H+ and K+/H+ antiporter
MELIKKNKVVIAIFLILLVLILIRSSGLNHFKNDAKKWAEPSLKQSNRITLDQAGSLTGKNLIINLDKDVSRIRELTSDAQNIPADSVLSKKHVTTIMKHDGLVLLFSSDPGLSARIWMILSQMGCRNIYILTNNADNEVFKYKFRIDTL